MPCAAQTISRRTHTRLFFLNNSSIWSLTQKTRMVLDSVSDRMLYAALKPTSNHLVLKEEQGGLSESVGDIRTLRSPG